jgi:predicted GNAT superfamily acetyltransferase
VRDIVAIDEMRATESVQRDVWGLADVDIVPAAQLKAAVHAGGQLAGAFENGTMIGFAYGMVARPHGAGMESIGLHSHMVAVKEQGRQRGVGRALKWFQRRWCLERGMPWITWTFDPLQSRNANLNFQHLGVVSHEYLVDFYGVMAGPLGGTASDRLVALWLLDSEPVKRRALEWTGVGRGGARDDRGSAAPHGAAADSGAKPTAHVTGPNRTDPGGAATVTDLWVLREKDIIAGDRGAVAAAMGAGAETATNRATEFRAAEFRAAEFRAALADTTRSITLRVATPQDVGSLKHTQPELVDRWRSGIRAAIIPALAAGFTIVGFSDGAYVLERRRRQESRT